MSSSHFIPIFITIVIIIIILIFIRSSCTLDYITKSKSPFKTFILCMYYGVFKDTIWH